LRSTFPIAVVITVQYIVFGFSYMRNLMDIWVRCLLLYLIFFKNKEYKKIYYYCAGSYPNSNRQIEPELMKIVLKNTLIDYHLTCKWSSGLLEESLSLIMPKKAIDSLAFTAEREELQYFLSMKHNTSTFFKIYGTEKLPGQMLDRSYFKVIMSLELHRFLYEWLYYMKKNKKKYWDLWIWLLINMALSRRWAVIANSLLCNEVSLYSYHNKKEFSFYRHITTSSYVCGKYIRKLIIEEPKL
jgi:hypothetical protein